jgi:7-cyano-7-deazaguanine synthase
MTEQASVVCLSGGQDSTMCLFYAVRRYAQVQAVTFDYGQRHRVELECAAGIAAEAGVEHVVLPIEVFPRLADASLTNPAIPSRLGAADIGNTYAAGSRFTAHLGGSFERRQGGISAELAHEIVTASTQL